MKSNINLSIEIEHDENLPFDARGAQEIVTALLHFVTFEDDFKYLSEILLKGTTVIAAGRRVNISNATTVLQSAAISRRG